MSSTPKQYLTAPERTGLFSKLRNMENSAPTQDKARRGKDLERLLYSVLRDEKLDPRVAYQNEGEQIDGSFMYFGRAFLVEAKWQKERIQHGPLDQFHAVVSGKLQGTLGVFISMSGYTDQSLISLTRGKALNLILFDKADMEAVFDRQISFTNALRFKLREATDSGLLLFPISGSAVTRSGISRALLTQSFNEADEGEKRLQAQAQMVVVCEGETDRWALEILVSRILADLSSRATVHIVPAGGKSNVPGVANAVFSAFPEARKIIVVDADGDPVSTRKVIDDELRVEADFVVVPEPEIESWFNLSPKRFGQLGHDWRAQLDFLVKNLGLLEMQARSDSFSDFYRAIRE